MLLVCSVLKNIAAQIRITCFAAEVTSPRYAKKNNVIYKLGKSFALFAHVEGT
jgi:hypothetical protein